MDIFMGVGKKTGFVYLFIIKSEPRDTIVLNDRASLGT